MGLVLASKACLDVREASEFWGRMAVLEKEEQAGDSVTFIALPSSG